MMQKSIVVRIRGRFDISRTNSLARTLKPRLDGLAAYVLDLRCTDEILDSGLALLLMAQRGARRLGATLYVITLRLDLINRCRALGINTELSCEPVAERHRQEVIEL